jgi:hypothetical protein
MGALQADIFCLHVLERAQVQCLVRTIDISRRLSSSTLAPQF